MTLTTAVLIACALAFATKAIGYAIPPRLVEGERTMRVSTLLPADHALAAAPSALFDAVAVVATKDGAEALADMPPAVQWLMDALNHLKVIGNAGADALLAKAGVPRQCDGVVTIGGAGDAKGFVTTARDEQRVFRRPH